MDLVLVLEKIRPNEDWGPCAQSDSSYADFAKTWRGKSSCPTLEEITTAWQQIKSGIDADRVTRESEILSAINILKTDVPENWKTSSNAQQRIAWAYKRLFKEINRSLKE